MNCPASISLAEHAPPQKESIYAKEGTCAHELAEAALLGDSNCNNFVGAVFNGWEVDQEMADYVQIYVDYVRKAGEGKFKDTLIEEKFDLSHIREGMFGSNDACIMEQFGTLEVIDLKYGKGKEVYPEENKQLMYYALGALSGGDFGEVKLTIIQPRVADPIKSWTTSVDRLNSFADELGHAVDATKREGAEAVAGAHCRFCPAQAICDKKLEQAREIARVNFEVPTPVGEGALPEPTRMDSETIKKVLDHSKQIKEWLDSVHVYAKHRLENGLEVEGYKLVRKRANRRIENENELRMAFGDGIYEKKLKGIGKLQKEFGKEVEQFLVKPQGDITLAPSYDKREEIKIDSAVNKLLENNYDDMEF
jgi:hypothetical protein